MVIQRIQTLWLLLATVLMIIVGLRPFWWVGPIPVNTGDVTILAILDWLTVALLALCIFTFKNLRLQKRIALLSIAMMAVMCVTAFVYQSQQLTGANFAWGGGMLFVGLSAICVIMAYRGMHSDQKKLRNSDRLWS